MHGGVTGEAGDRPPMSILQVAIRTERDPQPPVAPPIVRYRSQSGSSMQIDFAMGFVWFAGFLFSTTIHEAMHALAAWRLGDPTAYNGGQVSLSPVPQDLNLAHSRHGR
jgi:hypothetical protein